jgi:hypothetical protein
MLSGGRGGEEAGRATSEAASLRCGGGGGGRGGAREEGRGRRRKVRGGGHVKIRAPSDARSCGPLKGGAGRGTGGRTAGASLQMVARFSGQFLFFFLVVII